MVSDLIRDSPFGHIVRLVTGRKYFQYPEEKDHELWKKYVSEEKSGNMAHHGTAEPPEKESDDIDRSQGLRAREDSDSSSRTHIGEGRNEASGVRVDPEKGKDKHVIDWYGPDDPQVSLLDRSAHCRSLIAAIRTQGIGRERRSSS
jgi:DHA1 family multidrug resistance protein-like MFS transporter